MTPRQQYAIISPGYPKPGGRAFQRPGIFSKGRDEQGGMNQLARFSRLADGLVHHRAFEYTIIGVILFNAVLLGLATFPQARAYGEYISLGNRVVLGIFIVEALLKMLALAPRSHRYFRDGWNVFDFLVIVLSLIPTTGQFATIGRLARMLRIIRLISTVRELRLIASALMHALPSVFHVIMLLSIFVYIYAIIGNQLFRESSPDSWGSLGLSVLTLFSILTLDDWTKIMGNDMAATPLAWVFYVSYISIGTFVVINLFVAIIVNSLEEIREQHQRKVDRRLGPTREQLILELRHSRDTMRRLERMLEEEGYAVDEHREDASG